MVTSRQPAVAGLFYPDNPGELRADIRKYLADSDRPAASVVPKALIVPHAGYMYSAPVAASAYGLLASRASRISRVILLGPAHRVAVRGLALPSVGAFRTPLGFVPIDQEASEALLALPQVSINDATHAEEHSLEVHLPFLQEILGEFYLVPLVVGDATAHEVAEALDLVWGGEETLVVISSDLSHYLDYETAKALDKETSDAIEALDYESLNRDQACGRVPVSGLLRLARQKHLQCRAVDVRNSGDTAGSRDRVVGYGAYVLG